MAAALFAFLLPLIGFASKIKVELDEIRVTQFTVSRDEIRHRKSKLKRMSDKEISAIANSGEKTAVLGPKNKIYLVDGHHLFTALKELGVETAKVRVLADWSHLTEVQFWKKMEKNDFCFLFDETGRKRHYSDLPRSLEELIHDPYRTLAWRLRKEGVFEKQSAVAYQSHLWALALKKEFPDEVPSLKQAIRFAESARASLLPGLPGLPAGITSIQCQNFFTHFTSVKP